MIRPSTPDDMIALIAIADAIGFQPNELNQVSEMLADYFDGDSDSDRFWITDDDNGPVGVAYCWKSSEDTSRGCRAITATTVTA